MPAACNCSNTPCDCHEPVEPKSALALTAGTSTIIGARINKGTARELARFCASHDCTQSSVIREFVSQLTRSPHTRNLVALAKSSGPEAQLTTIREALGLEAAAGREEIVEKLDALFTLIGGDPAAAPAGDDPLEAAPEPAQLSAIEQRALAKIKEPAARAKFLALRRQRAIERKASSKPNRK